MKKLLPFIIIALLATSCGQKYYYSDIQMIPDERWSIDKPLTFRMNIEDSMQYYNMYLHIRNTTDFETQNFYVFMTTKFPDGHSDTDTLCLVLCDKFGKWTGKGNGRLKDNKFLFQPKIRFPQKGEYTFTVTQGMRSDEVEGISDFGIMLENFKN